MDLNTELELSLYEDLKTLHKSSKTEIILVCHSVTSKVYIKKILREYTIDVYEKLINVKSQNMPQLIDFFEVDDKLIIIEEYINGQTLQEMLKSQGHLNEDLVIEYMISLCEILDLLHHQNPPIIHRDIKPENIIISNDNILKLTDFDIARTYKFGENLDTTLLGTKGYASPEQFGFEQSDGRSDIYAIGVLMNVLTVGKHFKETLNNSKLRNIILKCTEISPKDRYENIKKLKYDLEILTMHDFVDENHDKYKVKSDIHHKSSSIIPGFRTNNKKNIFLASVFYLTLSTGLFAFDSLSSLIGNLILIIMALIYVGLFTNFMGVAQKFPLINNHNKSVRNFGYSLYSFIIFMSLGSLLTLFS